MINIRANVLEGYFKQHDDFYRGFDIYLEVLTKSYTGAIKYGSEVNYRYIFIFPNAPIKLHLY